MRKNERTCVLNVYIHNYVNLLVLRCTRFDWISSTAKLYNVIYLVACVSHNFTRFVQHVPFTLLDPILYYPLATHPYCTKTVRVSEHDVIYTFTFCSLRNMDDYMFHTNNRCSHDWQFFSPQLHISAAII